MRICRVCGGPLPENTPANVHACEKCVDPSPTLPSDERLAEIRARLQAATPGEWDATFYDVETVLVSTHIGAKHVAYCPSEASATKTPDSIFIAHVPADMTYLLSKLEEAQRENAAYKEQLTSGLCSIHHVPKPLTCRLCNKLRWIEGANLERMKIIDRLESQLTALQAEQKEGK